MLRRSIFLSLVNPYGSMNGNLVHRCRLQSLLASPPKNSRRINVQPLAGENRAASAPIR
jgi:hypothetical protein